MAVEITPLGFKKPDGNELVRGGDNVIADNAQKAEDVLADARARLVYVEAVAFSGAVLPFIEDPADPGFYITAEGP